MGVSVAQVSATDADIEPGLRYTIVSGKVRMSWLQTMRSSWSSRK